MVKRLLDDLSNLLVEVFRDQSCFDDVENAVESDRVSLCHEDKPACNWLTKL